MQARKLIVNVTLLITVAAPRTKPSAKPNPNPFPYPFPFSYPHSFPFPIPSPNNYLRISCMLDVVLPVPLFSRHIRLVLGQLLEKLWIGRVLAFSYLAEDKVVLAMRSSPSRSPPESILSVCPSACLYIAVQTSLLFILMKICIIAVLIVNMRLKFYQRIMTTIEFDKYIL